MQSALRSWNSYFARSRSTARGRADHWPKALPGCSAWTPDDGALLVIAPHPNDEILGAGGLIRSWATNGREVKVLSVSDGEAPDPGNESLASVRRHEVREALRKLCPTHVSVTRLGLPDGKIAEHLNRLRNAMQSSCREKVTLIAPYEHSGHPDHQGVGALCVDFARSQNVPIARYALCAQNDPESSHSGRWVRFALSDDARRAKARAIECFRSQIDGRAGEPPRPTHVPGDLQRSYEVFLL
jgi:LmbE family N-acetylglucosaminyl deacetylase